MNKPNQTDLSAAIGVPSPTMQKRIAAAAKAFPYRLELRTAIRNAIGWNAYRPVSVSKIAETERIAKKAGPIVDRYLRKVERGECDSSEFRKCAIGVAEALGVDPKKPEGRLEDITFGNIQKLVNISAKHSYIRAFLENMKVSGDWFVNPKSPRNNFRHCHCPMDRILMKRTLAEYRGKVRSFVEGCWSSIAWSKIVFGKTQNRFSISYYERFQDMVKELAASEGILPVEYDIVHWEAGRRHYPSYA